MALRIYNQRGELVTDSSTSVLEDILLELRSTASIQDGMQKLAEETLEEIKEMASR